MKKKINNLDLYYFEACPFCVRVLNVLEELDLDVGLQDISTSHTAKADLLSGGGRTMVPCLRIQSENGEIEWLYESQAIDQYLRDKFGS